MDKAELRKIVKARAAALDGGYIAESDAGILRNLVSLPEFIAARRVFTYISTGNEPDTRALIALCARSGKTVAVPAAHPGGKMAFAPLDRPPEALEAGAFGIPAPPSGLRALSPKADDLMLVPALCFDETAFRLGRGGGYYDRYLAASPVFSVGLCRERLVIQAVPRDAWDRPVACLVTEKRIARPE
ncbi:MAG: 5-formyltetrahydrofolate cyclo-ligase [Oscillospiraceae bacterium]|nr:5-formyltetrahydrofolate cyclo-ligase [Oscillospiraceae bacterium]